MNADETPTEANDNPGYVSPNISSAEEQEAQEEEQLDEAALEQKKRETVEIDGIPIDEKDIKYKATEIKRKADISYFVNVSEEPEEDPQGSKATGKDGEKKFDFDIKNIKNIATNLIKKPSAEKAEGEKAEKVDVAAKMKSIFVDGWHKYVTIGVVAAVLIIIGCMIIIPIIEKNSANTGDDTGSGEVKIYDNPFDRLKDTEMTNALLNYDFETVDRIYKEVEEDLESDDDIAKLYLDKAKRVLDADPTEKDRIYEAAKIAYKKGSDDPEIVKELYVIYGLLGDKEKAEEMNEALAALGVDIDGDDKEDDDDKEDGEKKDEDKKDTDKTKEADKTQESGDSKDASTTEKPKSNE